MPADLLDVILVVLAAAFAVEGYRQGFVVGALQSSRPAGLRGPGAAAPQRGVSAR